MNNVFLRGFAGFLISLAMLGGQNFALADEGMDLTPQISSDAEGFDSSNGAYSLRKKVDVSNSDILSQISLFSATAMGIDIITECKNLKPDIYAYMGASALYLGTSIIANQKLKKSNEELSQQMASLSGDKKADVTVLEQMKEGEVRRLKATRAKQLAQSLYLVGLVTAEVLTILTMIKDSTQKASQVDCSATAMAMAACMAAFIPLNFFLTPSLAAGQTRMMCKLDNTKLTFKEFMKQSFSGGGLSDMVLGFIVGQAGASQLGFAMAIGKKLYKNVALKAINNNTHKVRAIYYGAAMALTTVNIAITAKKQKEIKKNIKDVEKMISSYKSHTKNASITAGNMSSDDWNAYFQEISVNGNSTSGLGVEVDEVLRSIGRLDIKDIKLPANIKSPTLANSVAGLNNINKAIKSGQYGKAVASAGKLSKNLAKLQKISSGLKLKVNEQLKKAGKAPIDFEGKANSLAEKLNNGSGQALQDAGAQNALSKTEEPKSEEVKTAGGAQQAAEIAATQTPVEMEEDLFEEEGFEEDMMEVTSSNPVQDLNDYVVNKKDINNDRTKSIFSLLSVRYLKTAYPQLLEEAK